MSTRSIVLVKQVIGDKIVVKRLYKHHDGYPTDSLNMIYKALPALSMDIFISRCQAYYRPDMVEEEFVTSQNEPFNPEFLGCQGDLEWIYTIDLDKKQVKVFGGGYTGETPDVAYKQGPVDPLSYVHNLYDEYQDSERDSIQNSIDLIKSLGYTLNR